MVMKSKYVFGKLFARPSLSEGAGRLLDMGATMQHYNTSKTEAQADIDAIRNDWRAIGEDFNVSINQYEQKTFSAKSVA
jgi:predicted oxidoreductase (fatty acid repression mutant protein)